MLTDLLQPRTAEHPAIRDPWEAALTFGPGTIISLLVATEGPAYRNAGTMMAIAADGRFAGAISSGCIEADLIVQAAVLRASTGHCRRLRYGKGSPFMDLVLPCGGAIELMLFRLRDLDVLRQLQNLRTARHATSLSIDPQGRLALTAPLSSAPFTLCPDGSARINFSPRLKFLIFGAGPEVSVFSALVQGLGYDHLMLSHEARSLSVAAAMGCRTGRLDHLTGLNGLKIDAATACVLFYHDHDYEPAILNRLLATPSFYIGAQGSRATQAARLERLREHGADPDALERVRGPIGLIPSSRNPRTLAISVLSEIVAEAAHHPIELC